MQHRRLLMTRSNWCVSFASAGCLPDNDPAEFETEAEAAAYAEDLWAEFAADGISDHNLYSVEVYYLNA
jgi:hypothetical protein